VGDSSDNYPGVKNIGPKTARDLIVKYKTIEGIYKNINKIPDNIKEKLISGKKDAIFFKKLATVINDIKIDFQLSKCADWQLDSSEVYNLFMEFGFKSLLERIKYQVSGIKYKEQGDENKILQTNKIGQKQESLF
jgi:DNA polymerase-1